MWWLTGRLWPRDLRLWCAHYVRRARGWWRTRTCKHTWRHSPGDHHDADATYYCARCDAEAVLRYKRAGGFNTAHLYYHVVLPARSPCLDPTYASEESTWQAAQGAHA